MNHELEDPVRTANTLKVEYRKVFIRIDLLIERAKSGAEIRSFKAFQIPDRPARFLGLPDRREQLIRELKKYRTRVIEGEKGIERFYDLMAQNPVNALGTLRISMKDLKDLAGRVSGLESKVGGVQGPFERQSGRENATEPKPSGPAGSLVPVSLPPARGPTSELEIAYTSKNDIHGEDSVMEIANETGDLRGLVVCDGVTNTNGRMASSFVAEGLKNGFSKVKDVPDLAVMRSQLDLLLNSVARHLSDEASKRGVETATTMLMAFANRRGFYVYYLGDGTIRQFSEDAFSVGDYLMTYGREGGLQGYVSSGGISSRPTFLFVDSQVTPGNFLVLATDGAELSQLENHVTLGTMLRDDFVLKGKPLKEVLEGYLNALTDRADDATVAVVWKRIPST